VTAAPPVNWFGRISVQGWLGGLSLAAVAAGPLVRGVSRLAGRPVRPLRRELRWPFAVFTAGSAWTVLGFGAYLARVTQLALNYSREPLTVIWGYRSVRALAAASVAGGALFALRVRDLVSAGESPARDRAERWRLASGAAGATGLLAFGSYWGILPLEPRSGDLGR
jgi:hypothetical protein